MTIPAYIGVDLGVIIGLLLGILGQLIILNRRLKP